MDTLISNVTVVTLNERMEVLFGAYISITDGKISKISRSAHMLNNQAQMVWHKPLF